MARFLNRKGKKPGAPPGELVYVGEKPPQGVGIQLFEYTESSLEEHKIADPAACCPYLASAAISWLNVDGLNDLAALRKIGECFGLHPLVLEDICNTNQRPKVEDFESYIFAVLKMITYDRATERIKAEHISIILGKSFAISFQEDEGDVFDPLRQRIRTGKGRIRRMGADYLAYALMDSIVDHYFEALEKLGDDIEELEDELITDPGRKTINKIHRLKRELLYMRRAIWPLREGINNLLRAESPLVSHEVSIFLRDLYDHAVQVMDAVETLREIVSGMLDIYLSSISHRMNEIMKVLTIMSSIFIPLTFIAGVYGMNFQYMPELQWRYGYPMTIGFMVITALGLLLFFRRRGWI